MSVCVTGKVPSFCSEALVDVENIDLTNILNMAFIYRYVGTKFDEYFN